MVWPNYLYYLSVAKARTIPFPIMAAVYNISVGFCQFSGLEPVLPESVSMQVSLIEAASLLFYLFQYFNNGEEIRIGVLYNFIDRLRELERVVS